MKHLLNPGGNPVCTGVGGVLDKPRPQVLIYPSEPSVCMGLGTMVNKPRLQDQTHLRPIKVYMVLC
jgi:hypothetical protein